MREEYVMAHLVNCFECGAEISSKAEKYPICKAPKGGYQCGICCMADKRDNLSSYKGGVAHAECLSKVRNEYDSFVYTCLICQKKVGAGVYTCPSCGHPFPDWLETKYCEWCRLPVVRGAAKKVSAEYPGSEYHSYYHQYCCKYSKKCRLCFLATALYGEDSCKVRMLCFFRDEYLSASSLGRAFIALYVRVYPTIRCIHIKQTAKQRKESKQQGCLSQRTTRRRNFLCIHEKVRST
jgi:hypothetical protein